MSSGFNVDLGKQFVPFWNGLIHLVGRVENGTIIRRYDWTDIIQECENFEKNYMNSTSFCESCTFYGMPSYLEKKMEEAKQAGITDCKTIAKDNDFLFLYCQEKMEKRGKGWVWIPLILLLLLLFCVVGVILLKSVNLSRQV